MELTGGKPPYVKVDDREENLLARQEFVTEENLSRYSKEELVALIMALEYATDRYVFQTPDTWDLDAKDKAFDLMPVVLMACAAIVSGFLIVAFGIFLCGWAGSL